MIKQVKIRNIHPTYSTLLSSNINQTNKLESITNKLLITTCVINK